MKLPIIIHYGINDHSHTSESTFAILRKYAVYAGNTIIYVTFVNSARVNDIFYESI